MQAVSALTKNVKCMKSSSQTKLPQLKKNYFFNTGKTVSMYYF